MREERIGGATLYLGDCREHLPGYKSGHTIIFDPPYGIAHTSNYVGPTTTAAWMNRKIANDDSLAIRDFVLSSHCGAWAAFATIKMPPPAVYRGCIVWDKGPSAGMGDLAFPWKPSWELIYLGGPGWSGARDEGVQRFVSVSRASMGRTHPNEKPVPLLRHLIQKAPAGTICDPTMGTGATGVAAILEGRPFVGIEFDEGYFSVAVERIMAAQRQRDLFIDAPPPEDPADARLRDLFAEPGAA